MAKVMTKSRKKSRAADEINRLHGEVVSGLSTIQKDRERLQELMKAELLHWVQERVEIRRKRRQGESRPWTEDPILQTYRFCNVRREHDRETIWRAEHWRDPHADDPDVWFAMAVGAFLPWHATCAPLGYPVPWNRLRFRQVLRDRTLSRGKTWSSAYRVFGVGKAATKAETVARTLSALWKDRHKLRGMAGGTLAKAHRMLTGYPGIGSFLAAQIVADLKHTRTLADARDWWFWAASGPGSQRGLNRMLGRYPKSPWVESDWLSALQDLHDELRPELLDILDEPLHNQDFQNVLCEVDKYLRVKLGKDKLRARYDGASGDGRPETCPVCGSAECQSITDPIDHDAVQQQS